MNFSDFNQAFQPFSDNDFSDFLFQDNAMDLLKGPTPDFSIANNAFPSPPRSIHNFSPANVMELLNLNSFPEFSMPMPVASQSFNNVPMFSTFQSPLQTLDFSPSLDSIFNNSFPQQIMGSNGNMQFKQLSFSSASSSSPELGFAPLIRSQTLSPPFISASPAFSASGFSTESAPRRNLGVRTRAIAHVKPAKEGFNRNLKIMKEDVAVCSGCSVEIATIILHGFG